MWLRLLPFLRKLECGRRSFQTTVVEVSSPASSLYHPKPPLHVPSQPKPLLENPLPAPTEPILEKPTSCTSLSVNLPLYCSSMSMPSELPAGWINVFCPHCGEVAGQYNRSKNPGLRDKATWLMRVWDPDTKKWGERLPYKCTQRCHLCPGPDKAWIIDSRGCCRNTPTEPILEKPSSMSMPSEFPALVNLSTILGEEVATMIADTLDLSANDLRWITPDGRDVTDLCNKQSANGGFSSRKWTLRGWILDRVSVSDLKEEFPDEF